MTPKISILFLNDLPERLDFEYSLKTMPFCRDEEARLRRSYDRDIEEKRNIRDKIARHLEESGFDVKTPTFALEKLNSSYYISEFSFNLALQYSPNLILCDLWSFSDGDGLSLCEHLRRDERTSHIPVLMITPWKPGYMKDIVIKHNWTLADDFVAKPLDLEELDVCLNTLLLRY